MRDSAWTGLLLPAILACAGSVAHAAPAQVFDRGPAGAEALGILKDLIRIRTVNPPGNEAVLLRHVGGLLEGEGIDWEMVEPEPGRGALRAVLKGDGSRPALLVLAHVDVVGIEEGKWSVDPFAAVEKDGYLYGRGAIDDKGMAAAAIESLLLLKRSGRRLSRDVILILEGDEESGGELGIRWVLDNRPDWVEGVGFALNEGGRVITDASGRVLYVGVQVVEKIPFNVEITARGGSGHASVPREDNAILRLGRALGRLSAHRPRARFLPETREFFDGLARVVPSAGGRDPAALSRDPLYNAMLRDTFSPTILASGIRTNVIPSEAKANLNCRILPDTSPGRFVDELRSAAGDEGLEWRIVKDPAPPPPVSPMDSDLVRAIRSAAAELWPEAPVLPLLSTGATDSRTLRKAGIPAYGLLPFPLTTEDVSRMHGNDERVPLESFAAGVELLHRTISDVSR